MFFIKIIPQFRTGRAVTLYVQHLVKIHQPGEKGGFLVLEEING